MIHRAYKYRIYPSEEQAVELNKVFGCVRFLWNQLVANFHLYPNHDPNLSEKTLKDDERYPFLKETISCALQQKRNDFEEFKRQYFSKSRKKKLGKPKFKSKHAHFDSFRIPGQSLGYEKCINWDKGEIKIPKFRPIKLVVDRKFTGKLCSITISRNPAGQFFVSVLVEEDDPQHLEKTGRFIGIDLGLTHLAIFSDGTKIDNPRWFRENQAKLARAQRHLSRKTKGSNRRERQRVKVAKIHLKTANQRKWFYHDLSNKLLNEFDVICLESLNVAGMKKSSLGKSISDASWSTLISMLKHKSEWYGKKLHQIYRWFPSSKSCSECGSIQEKLKLDVRHWTCTDCGTKHDRDTNAARNILNKGLTDLNLSLAECVDYTRGEKIRPSLQLAEKAHLVEACTETVNDLYCFG